MAPGSSHSRSKIMSCLKPNVPMRPDLDSLSLFVVAVETRSLTKAADVSSMSLAAASRRISLLEDRFGARLLERTPKGIEPTDAGLALLAHAKALLLDVDRLQADMNDFAQGNKGAVRVLATTSAMTHFLPRDLAEFGIAHPDVRLAISERWSEEIARKVMDLSADLGIVVEGCRTHDLETRLYRTYRIAVIVRPEHPLARAESLSYADVLDHEVVALENESLMMRSLFEQALLAQKPLRVRVQVRSFEAVCRLVQAGLGVGLLPMAPVTGLAHDMGLEIRPLPEDWAERKMLLCFRREGKRSKSLATLIDHLTMPGRPAKARVPSSPDLRR